MKHFAQKKCFITGAASGIGRAVALALAEDGAQLALTDINASALQQVASEVQQRGATVLGVFPADIADNTAVKAMATQLHQAHGAMDVVMNIAGISTWGTIDNLQHQHWRNLVEINLMGPIQVLEAFVPAMIAAKKGGHIVNVSSAAGLFGLPWHAAYSATKFGLRGVSEVLRFDLRQHNIGVSLVCPGAVNTGLVQTINIVGIDKEHPKAQRLVKRFQRHAVTPEHAAKCILRGVRNNKYWVFTSRDIQFAHWFTRKWEWPYTVVMRLMSALVVRTKNAIEADKTQR